MSPGSLDRRRFLARCAQAVSAAALPLAATAIAGPPKPRPVKPRSGKPRSKVERAGVGVVGLRYQGTVIAEQAKAYGDIVALCDVDRQVLDETTAKFGGTQKAFEDYREMLARPEVDVVLIGTPDHWHAKMVVDACRAGKDVYVEKPLTLTIDEGRWITKVAKATGRIVQVGSWQRSDHRFRLAIELIRAGRLGKLERVDVVLAKNPSGGPFAKLEAPAHLNWDSWQGQTTDVPYIKERCHYTFRWWQEYSGGKMTDWGAHHLDIAQWGIDSLPVAVDGRAKYPDIPDGYNVATDFGATYKFANGMVMTVRDEGRNGIMFTGSRGRVFVNRGTISGKPVEDLAQNPLPREAFVAYEHDNLNRPPRTGKLDAITNHMGNFFDCIVSRKQPISDAHSQHQSATTCHLGNISMQLGRRLQWDSQQEAFVDDREANALMSRQQRDGFQLA